MRWQRGLKLARRQRRIQRRRRAVIQRAGQVPGMGMGVNWFSATKMRLQKILNDWKSSLHYYMNVACSRNVSDLENDSVRHTSM